MNQRICFTLGMTIVFLSVCRYRVSGLSRLAAVCSSNCGSRMNSCLKSYLGYDDEPDLLLDEDSRRTSRKSHGLPAEHVPSFSWSTRRKDCWRPTTSDVEWISWGKPARQKGTGSRGVPHRLNSEERFLFDQARQKGYLEVLGSGWRGTRRDAPLINSWRSWCDARAHVCLILHKGNGSTMLGDDIVLDLSPLRMPEIFEQVGNEVDAWMQGNSGTGPISPPVVMEPFSSIEFTDDSTGTFLQETDEDLGMDDDGIDNSVSREDSKSSPWEERPIYHLPTVIRRWEGLNRSEAKKILKLLSAAFETRDDSSPSIASKKPIHVKHGKSRRSGGYGIG